MLRIFIFSAALCLPMANALAETSRFSDLYGKHCTALAGEPESGISTRRCSGVAGYSLLIHEAHAQTTVDIVTPAQVVYPLQLWEVVTPGLAYVGRKAEWRMGMRGGRAVPTALLLRLDTRNPQSEGPRLAGGAILTASRIAADGACVVYQGSATPRQADALARAAVQDGRRHCLGVFQVDAAR
ncbi:MAG: hypothetical protein ACJ8GW_10330 [Massilia sp.]